jgi:3',5'-cyclic AMP phosphodiesterase CpdA
VIVVSGDLTQRAKPEQFIKAKGFINQLPAAPRVIVPGNHDVPLYRVAERMARPHQCYQQHIQEELNHVVKVDGAVFVALDSTSPRRAISNGRVHVEQLDFCADAFRDANPDDAKIIVAHHHFAPAPDYERDQTMPKARRAMNHFIELGVDLILGGHLHRAYIGNSLDFYPGNVRDRGTIIVQCGTTTSRRGRGREREKNSFNLIRIGSKTVDITHYLYFDSDEEFAPLSRHEFPRPGKRFGGVDGQLS